LEQELCCQLFHGFLADCYHGTLGCLNQRLREEKETQKLLTQLQNHVLLERRYLLRCVKHLYGFWQDPNHPDRVRGGAGRRKGGAGWLSGAVCVHV